MQAYAEQVVQVWDIGKKQILHVLGEQHQGIQPFGFSLDGHFIISITLADNGLTWEMPP